MITNVMFILLSHAGVSMSNLYKDRYDAPAKGAADGDERATRDIKRQVNAGLAQAAAASASQRAGGKLSLNPKP